MPTVIKKAPTWHDEESYANKQKPNLHIIPTLKEQPTPKAVSEKPHALEPLFDNIPPVLREGRKWVLWEYKKQGDRVAKPPLQINESYASVDNDDTWATFEEVRRAYERGCFDGVGRVCERVDNIAVIDLDHCIDLNTGVTSEEAMTIMKRIGSYSELSPSGTGFRIACIIDPTLKPDACIPAGTVFRGIRVEMYFEKKYLTFTGHVLGEYTGVEDRTIEILKLYKEIKATDKTARADTQQQQHATKSQATVDEDEYSLPDDEIVRLAKASTTLDENHGATKGKMFAARYDGSCEFDQQYDQSTGEWRDNPSKRDSSLGDSLAWWTRCDFNQMYDIFMQSGCVSEERIRTKRNGNLRAYEQYVLDTLQDCIDRCTSVREWKPNEKEQEEEDDDDMNEEEQKGSDGGKEERKQSTSDKPKNAFTPTISSFQSLQTKQFAPMKWIIEDILPEGLYLLAGKSKMGKSWMLLGLAVAVASGGIALGKKHVERGDVLYLALEDSERRLQSRLSTILPPGKTLPSNLEYATQWTKMNADGLTALEQWIEAHPQARLIIVDTWAKVKPDSKKKNAYDADYDVITPLWHLANKYGICILLTLHLRKASASDALDEINATTGLAGAADGTLILKRERGNADATLFGTGRDLNEFDVALSFKEGLWTLLGNAEDCRKSKERQAIISAVAGGCTSIREIADAVGRRNDSSLRKLLSLMVQDGELRSINRGTYTMPFKKTV